MSLTDEDFYAFDQLLEAADNRGLAIESRVDKSNTRCAVLSRVVNLGPGQKPEFEPIAVLLSPEQAAELSVPPAES